MTRLIIDLEADDVVVETGAGATRHSIGSPQAFAAISRAWLRSGWDNKHVYSFTWLGRPVIQLPEDLVRVQEAIYRVKPDVILETGIAHGGSLVFYASLCRAMGRGRVIGVDVDIRPHNRPAIEGHELYDLITLIEADSIAPDTVEQVKSAIDAGESVFVVLDSNHTKAHVRAELGAYAPLVSVGSYAVAADGIMADLKGAPRSRDDWDWNNPREAALEFVASDDRFVIEPPPFAFNEGTVEEPVTYWPDAWLKRVR